MVVTATDRVRARAPEVVAGTAAALLAAGAVATWAGGTTAGRACWTAAASIGLVAAVAWSVGALRRRRVGADVVAVLALVGSIAVGEEFAGAVVAVMLGTGRLLEARANRRASAELTALADRAPRDVQRIEGATVATRPIEEVDVGDLLVVQRGEFVPVDGRVEDGVATLDESALTGEALPLDRRRGDGVRSGTVNAGNAFTMRATARAADSTYAGILDLIADAEEAAASAPFVRLADRYAGGFVGLSIAVALAAWVLSGDPVRAVAVLVVATPCPLILAAPVAVTAGISRAASRGVVIRDGAALERLAEVRIALLDKTGTLTAGRPAVTELVSAGDRSPDEVLRLAASLEQFSAHVLAGAIVTAAHDRNLALSLPTGVEEIPGSGTRGWVGTTRVALGKRAWVAPPPSPAWSRTLQRRVDGDPATVVFVALDGSPAGALILEDPVRADAARAIRALRHDGIARVMLVSGDRADVTESLGAMLGADASVAECTPADKAEVVAAERAGGVTMMVGDGINDAVALGRADVGVAVTARASGATAGVADILLTTDRLDRLGEARVIARRATTIARQSVIAGIGLSLAAMSVASAGLLAPAAGAVTQELIDTATILNSLRARRRIRHRSRRLPAADAELAQRFIADHRRLRPGLDGLRRAADSLGTKRHDEAVGEVRVAFDFLAGEIGPHEQAEGALLYPVLDRVLGARDSTATMHRAHAEIARLTRRLGRVLETVDAGRLDDVDIVELRRLLYGLHAVLLLHFAQEEEEYFTLLDDSGSRADDGDGAGGVLGDGVGDRAEQQGPEPATSA